LRVPFCVEFSSTTILIGTLSFCNPFYGYL
jgi:hypothetical protein